MARNFFLQLLFAVSALGAAISAPKSSFKIGAGSKWQIILSGTLKDVSSSLAPAGADIWDLDLFNTPVETISTLKGMGKTVICYFSAGTSEPSRPDLGSLGSGDSGSELKDWPGEYWLNLKSDNVWNIMANRIQLAAKNGCDAVDPDNMDGYEENGGGLGLTQEDSVAFMQKMAKAASQYGLGIGLKNSMNILPSVQDLIQFAVNEECVKHSECNTYDSFISSGKPVLHIEYSDMSSACTVGNGFSTVVKQLALGGYVQYCDGSSYTTPTN